MALSRARRRIVVGLALTVGLLLTALLMMGLVGRARLTQRHDPPLTLVTVPHDSATLQRGEHLFLLLGCTSCHGPAMGGGVVADIPLGRFVASNLTSGTGGVGTSYQVQDWDRAIRFGLRPDGTALIPVMPYRRFNYLADSDAAALIAYLQRLAPVDSHLPSSIIRLPGYLLAGMTSPETLFGKLIRPPAAPPEMATEAYGGYVADITCRDCHGEQLRGGKHPDPEAPPAPTLQAAAYWPEDSFATAVRTGVAPGGRALSFWMPVNRLQYLSDVEVRAVYAYLQQLKASADIK